MCSSLDRTSGDAATNRRLTYAALINCAFVVLEFTAGILSGSLALVADSIHNAVDSITIGVALLAGRLAGRPADRWRTYGYHRTKPLAALLNAFILFLVILGIGYHAIERFTKPVHVDSSVVVITGLIGVLANLSIVLILRASRHQLHVRAPYWHNLTDAASSALVAVSGALIYLTGAYWVDLVLSLLICGLLAKSVVPTVRESVHILLEGAPDGADGDRVRQTILRFPEVVDVHDVHTWLTGEGMAAVTCHVVLRADVPHEQDHDIVERIRAALRDELGVYHSTIMPEHKRCEQAERCTWNGHDHP